MEISWLDFSEEDKKRVMDVYELWKEPGAVDELGVGVIRDYFAEKLFPGTSTRHTKAKYLVLTPYIFKNIEKNMPTSSKEYLKLLAKEEEKCAKKLMEMNPNEDSGIIGIRNLKSHPQKWVKVGPAEIYWGALRKYGIFKIDGLSLKSYIQEVIRLKVDSKMSYKYRKTETLEGSGDDENIISNYNSNNFWNMPENAYNNWMENSGAIELSEDESRFLQERILATQEGTLLAECIRDKDRMNDFVNLLQGEKDSDLFDNLEGIIKKWNLPENTKNEYELAKNVSDFIYCVQIRFNCIIDNDRWQEEWEKYKETIPQILKSEYLLQLFKQDNELGEIISRNKILNNFLTKLKNLMTNNLNDEDFENELDKLVINWEKDKKKSKAKLEKDIESNGEWQGLAKLNYRIKNAQNLVREIMEGLYKC